MSLVLAAQAVSVSVASAQQQAQVCNQIRVEIAALDRQGSMSGAGAANAREVQRLRTELSRVQLAFRQNDCGNRGFFSSPAPVCGPLQAQAGQMEARLRQLQGSGSAGGADAGRRAQLVSAYQRYNCDGPREPQRGVIYAGPQAPSLFEQLFGGRSAAVVDPPREQPREPIDPELEDELRERARLGGRLAICVRTCDGFFFPVNFEGLAGTDSYSEVRRALCPAAETEVFFMRLGADVETAATRSGQAYASMPYARLFQQKREDACFCKPTNVTWAQASKGVEDIVEARKGDVIVTPEQALAMSRPKEAPGTARNAQRRNQRQPQPATPQDETPSAAPLSQIPTAGTASAGIGPRVQGNLGPSQGQMQDVVGPDGKTRQIRVVSPNRIAQ